MRSALDTVLHAQMPAAAPVYYSTWMDHTASVLDVKLHVTFGLDVVVCQHQMWQL